MIGWVMNLTRRTYRTTFQSRRSHDGPDRLHCHSRPTWEGASPGAEHDRKGMQGYGSSVGQMSYCKRSDLPNYRNPYPYRRPCSVWSAMRWSASRPRPPQESFRPERPFRWERGPDQGSDRPNHYRILSLDPSLSQWQRQLAVADGREMGQGTIATVLLTYSIRSVGDRLSLVRGSYRITIRQVHVLCRA